ncbi:hypothetical protein HSX37_06795|uniref:WYL domain-containing protein n=1 Tax=Dendrosporobacter quercicolus TaxID=146817 RepID=A0A1G9W0N8_9FIRM|nr:hypothetical protein [Dendrosporobacter quercicolus]NSL47750.1 hypothetical protein [Dendrosporobacter quercicolus DSM 1736]SDM78119.1 hypothetical protein SAMN04488502_10791 [Dendrosporobacter quercicolus]
MDKKLLFSFADAIHRKKIIQLTYITKELQQQERKCAPLDMAPSRRAKIPFYKYHVWDFDSQPKPHIVSLNPEQIIQIELLDEEFKPEDIVTWDTTKSPWSIVRDWGRLS